VTLGWAEVERSVVRAAEAANLVLDAECAATAVSEELVNVVATAAFVLLLFLKVVGIRVVDVEEAIARLEMGETLVEGVEVEVESLALIETLYAETESTASDPKITC
jgi:hypothetical protein